jgi:hypothetical protein
MKLSMYVFVIYVINNNPQFSELRMHMIEDCSFVRFPL